jgi:ABC-type Fe3+-hydroxamate transport system substrate-binding protein
MGVSDQLNRTLHFSNPPKRIVSLVPSQTELLVDLGLRDQLVGVTKFCVHPTSLRKETSVVGGTKEIHLEKIKALCPDIIICNKEENTKEIVEACSSIAPVWVSDIYTIEDSLEMITMLGEIFNVSEKASEIVTSISSEKKKFLEFVQNKPVKKVAYLIWNNPYMAAGTNTFIHTLLQLNRFENIISEPRYPEISMDLLKKADLILLSSEPFPFKDSHAKVLQEALQKPVIVVDGEYFSWYGSRLRKAFAYFNTLKC